MNADILIDLNKRADERGALVAIEEGRSIPFEIKRVYYLKDLKADHPRGFHAHRKLRQFAVALSGKCKILMDNGLTRKEFVLDSFSKGILIDPMVWHEMHDFSGDCIFLVLASDFYDESDYIRNYDEFMKLVNLDKVHK